MAYHKKLTAKGILFAPVHCSKGQMNLSPASSSHSKCKEQLPPKSRGSWLPWSDPPYPALPCYPLQIPREESKKHSTGKQRACIPALQRTCWGSGGGHLTCLLLSSSTVKWRGWPRTWHFFSEEKSDKAHFHGRNCITWKNIMCI